MNICVVGTGYVGLVAGTCFSDLGFRVTCVDTVAEKIRALQRGEVPIYEPGLDALIRRNVREGRLHFTLDGGPALASADVVFIAVGTPGLPDGSADLSQVLAVAEAIAADKGETFEWSVEDKNTLVLSRRSKRAMRVLKNSIRR